MTPRRSSGSAGSRTAGSSHDRRIHVPCDDSVVRAVDGAGAARCAAPAATRRCRSLLPFEVAPTLAVGADLKNAFCLAEGRLAWLSAHVGDMDDLATLTAFGTAEEHLRLITGVVPEQLAADRHPAYRSRRWAARARRRAVPWSRCSTTTPTSPRRWPSTASARTTRSSGSPSTGRGTATTAPPGAASSWRRRTRRTPGWRTSPTSTCPAGTPACGTRAGWRSRTSARPASPWDERLPAVRACRDDELRLLDQQLDASYGVRAHLEHGPALRRGRLARRRLPPRRVRRPGRDGAGGDHRRAARRAGLRLRHRRRATAAGASTPRPSSREVVDDVLARRRPPTWSLPASTGPSPTSSWSWPSARPRPRD